MNDLDDLATTFKEVDVTAISLAIDSGKLHQRASTSLWAMWGMVVLLGLFVALALLTWGLDPTSLRKLAILAIMGTCASGMLVFTLRQQHAFRAAGDQLLGSGADVVRGRIELLDMERHAWVGRIATASLVCGVALCVAWVVVGWVTNLVGPIALGLVTGAGLLAFAAYGYRVRVPLLTAEIERLQQLVSELEEE